MCKIWLASWAWLRSQLARAAALRRLPHSLQLLPPYNIRNEIDLQPNRVFATLLRDAIQAIEIEPGLDGEPPRVWLTLDNVLVVMASAFGAVAYHDRADRDARASQPARELALSLCNAGWTPIGIHVLRERWGDFLRISDTGRVVLDVVPDDTGYQVALYVNSATLPAIRRLSSAAQEIDFSLDRKV